MTHEHAAPYAIEAIPTDQLNDQGNGEVTATVGAHPNLRRLDGTPAQDGDVLSVQKDGTLQSREAGTNGWSERAKVKGPWLVYRPDVDGAPKRVFLQPLVDDW